MKKIVALWVLLCVGCGLKAQLEVNVPQNLNVSQIDDNSALLSWQKEEGIYKYIVSYNMAMSDQIIEQETSDTSLYIDNLVSATQYLWRIRAISVDMDTSDWSDLYSFYTSGFTTDCSEVSHLKLFSVNETSLAISWQADENTLYWEIVVDEMGSNPDNIGKRYFTTDMEYVFNNLEKGLVYQFAVRSHCEGSYGNWSYIYANYTFQNSLPTLPIQIDLNNTNSLDSIGLVSSNSNPWTIDYVLDNNTLSTEKYLYISNNKTQTPTFNNNKKSYSFAYIDFIVPEESTGFYLDFDYKSSLVSDKDGMQVYLLSNGHSLDIDSSIEITYLYGDTIYNNTNNVWKDAHIEFPDNFDSSPRKIVFMWTNTDTCQSNSSILIKDISITPRYCPVPDSLSATNITYCTAEINWVLDDFQQSFNLQYQKSTDSTWITINDIFSGYVLDSLEENTLYFYRIQANCTDQQSFYSDMQSFHTAIFLDLVDTASITYDISYNSATLTWDEKDNVKLYRIEYKANSEDSLWLTTETSVASCTIENLAPTTEYIFKICIITMQDLVSKYTPKLSFTTTCAPVVDFPYLMSDEIIYTSQDGFSIVPYCFDSSFVLLQTPVFDISELGLTELSFDITSNSHALFYISKDGGKTYTNFGSFTPSVIDTSVYTNFSFLLSDYIMEDEIKIRFLFNTTGLNNIVAKLTNLSIKKACSAPKSINIDDISTDYFTCSWSTDDITSSWLVKLYDANDSLLQSATLSYASTSFTSLTENTTYKVVLRSYCSSIESADSSITYVTTLSSDEGICYAPTSFKAYWYQTKGEETIIAKWDTVKNAKIWEVWYKDLYAMQWSQKIVTLTPQFSLRNLDFGDTYLLKVRTICNPGDTSDFTQTLTVHIGTDSSSLITLDTDTQINIYPNPTSNIVNIECSNAKISSLTLTSLNGATLLTSQSPYLDLSNLPNGTYILCGYINDKRFARKIIKQ